MNERERIEAMVSDGTLTREEADRLIGVLDDLDGVDRDMAAMDADLQPEGAPVDAGGPRPSAAPAAHGSGASAAAEPDVARERPAENRAERAAGRAERAHERTRRTHERSERMHERAQDRAERAREHIGHAVERASRAVEDAVGGIGRGIGPRGGETGTSREWLPIAPDGVKWLRVEMLAGDLAVRVDPQRSSPSVSSHGRGEADLTATDGGAVFRQIPPRGGDRGLVDRILDGLGRGDAEIALPEGWGVELAVRAGDVDLHGVRWLRGSLTAGDLEADALEGIDLTMSAGDVDIALRPTAGEHRLAVSAGDVDVRLLAGSSVHVTGGVSIGDVDTSAPLGSRSAGLGERLEGTVGEGAAELLVRVSTGDLDITAEGA